MDALLIAVAFFFGLIAQQFGLPPMVGFLISGFVLHAFGQRGGETLETISDLGVTLMLFTIGLKLRLRGLLRPEIWAGTSLHIAGTSAAFGLIFLGLWAFGAPLFGSLTIWTALLQFKEGIDLVILAMPKHSANLQAAQTLKRHSYKGLVAALAKFDDEVKELRSVGVDTAFDLYSEAGAGFADHVCNVFNQHRPEVFRVLEGMQR